MEKAFAKAFFMLDMHAALVTVVDSCHTCAALKNVPSSFQKQTTSTVIDRIGSSFSTDVIKDNGQLILIIRESISSITAATLIPDEKANSLRDGLTITISGLRSSMSPPAVIRTDPASGFRHLVHDQSLQAMNLQIELGDEKNPNKNPVAESAVKDVRAELIRLQPHGGKVSQSTLSHAILNLNSRVRHNNLSAFEIWTQREMISGNKLELDDTELIKDKINHRSESHLPSAKYKARGKTVEKIPNVQVGDIVYLYVDRTKSRSRDKYIIVEISDNYAQVQKLLDKQIRARKYRVKLTELITVQTYPVYSAEYWRKPTPQHQPYSVVSDMHDPPNMVDATQQSSVTPLDDELSDEENLTVSDILHKLHPPLRPPVIIVTPPVNTRPRRVRRRPRRLNDYIVEMGQNTPILEPDDTPLPDSDDN